MILPGNIYRESTIDHSVPSSIYQQASQLLASEKYEDSLVAINTAILNADHLPTHEQRMPVAEAFAVYLWNLLYLKRFRDFDSAREGLADTAMSESLLLNAVFLWRDIEKGKWEYVLNEADKTLKVFEEHDEGTLAEFYLLRGYARSKLGSLEAAIDDGEIARALFVVKNKIFRSAFACNLLGMFHHQRSRYTFALDWYGRAAKIFDDCGSRRRLSMIHLNTGITHYKIGDYRTSLDHLRKSLAVGKKGGWIHRQCFANIALGNVHRIQRDFEAARRHLHEAYSQAQELQYPREEALTLEFLGDVYRDESQFVDARRFYGRAMAIAMEIAPEGDIVMEVNRRLGECCVGEGDAKGAMAALNRALELARAQGDRFEEAVALRVMADAVLELGDAGTSRRWIDESITTLGKIGARHELALSLLASANLSLTELERVTVSGERSRILDLAWQQATQALNDLIEIDALWWIGKARLLVDRIGRLRTAHARAEREAVPSSSNVYDPGDVIVHASGRIRDLLQLTDMFATSSEPVLITGETGTGKELFARRIHEGSDRTGKLVTVNVAAITPTLFEREFFGHVRGAFSGADRDAEGFAARACGGTLFLDEIGDLPLEIQPKLLRLLQEGTYQALGDPDERHTDIRLVAATNAGLARRVEEGRFRADLWYRLRILELELPAIRDRREDVLPLLRHFLSLAAGRHVELGEYFDPVSQEAAERWEWSGNVREIALAARRAHLDLQSRGRVHVELVAEGGRRLVLCGGLRNAFVAANGGLPSHEAVERSRILMALEDSRGNRREAAHRLGVGRSTLYRRMVRLGIPTKKA